MNPIDLEAFVSVVDRGSIVAIAAGLPLAPDRRLTERLSDESRIGVPTVGQDC
jgi:hypothetical protein